MNCGSFIKKNDSYIHKQCLHFAENLRISVDFQGDILIFKYNLNIVKHKTAYGEFFLFDIQFIILPIS